MPSSKNVEETLFSYSQNIKGYRDKDPETSKQASQNVTFRKSSQLFTLLYKYYERGIQQEFPTEGYTDEEAGVVSGLYKRPRCCYWKRCSELRKMGLIKPNGQKRMSSANELQAVSIITPEGEGLIRKSLLTNL